MECSMLNRAPESIPAPRPEARQPRGAVKLNGKIVPGWDSLEVGNNAYRSADTFRVVFAVSQLPESRNAMWFSEQKAWKWRFLPDFQRTRNILRPKNWSA